MRVSRGTLMRATADLQAELEERINEGFLARIRRYVSDRELRDRLALARAAKVALENEK